MPDGPFLFHSDLEFTPEPLWVLSLYGLELHILFLADFQELADRWSLEGLRHALRQHVSR